MRPVSKRLKALTAVFVCVLILCAVGAGILLYTQYANIPKPIIKKAFIILPDLMGSNLLDAQNDNAVVWSAEPSWLISKEEETPGFINTYIKSAFNFDENSNPDKELTPAEDDYAFDGMTKILSNYLFTEYSDDGYEVITWQYDWRQSVLDTAQKLEGFIEGRGYTNLVFISHGMGGNVVAKYLTKASNRIKTDLFLPIAAPFLGTLGTLDLIIEKEASLGGYVNTQYSQLMQSLGVYELIEDMPSLADLISYPAMSQLSAYAENEAPVLLNGSKVIYNEIYDYFCSLGFTKTDTESLKPVYENLIENQRMDFIKKDGKYRHITEFVDTVYIVGTGIGTRYIADINTATGKIASFSYDNLGDGFVWAFSATAGRSLASDNVIVVDANKIDYSGHDDIISSHEVLELLKQVIINKLNIDSK